MTRIVSALLVFGAAAMAANAAGDMLSDADLVARANAVMSVKEAPVDRMLGIHKGGAVIVDVRCADVCPQYTVRIIHYTAAPGSDCTRLGGDTASIMVPVSITTHPQPFCIPHVLYGKQLYTDHPYQH
jgi:hypothetical protein